MINKGLKGDNPTVKGGGTINAKEGCLGKLS